MIDAYSCTKIDETIDSAAALSDANNVMRLHVPMYESVGMDCTQSCCYLTADLCNFGGADRPLFKHLIHRCTRNKFFDNVDHSIRYTVIETLWHERAIDAVKHQTFSHCKWLSAIDCSNELNGKLCGHRLA